jgi:membrane protein implicated in regulation of membrane protease activity
MTLQWNWVLVISGALMILAEVLLGGFTGFDLFLVGSSFLVGGAVGLVMHSVTAGLIATSVLCVLYIAVGRRWVKSRIKGRATSSNVDALIGARGRILVRVADHEPGQVKVRDEVWRAQAAVGAAVPIEPGAEVTVEGVDGVTLKVR